MTPFSSLFCCRPSANWAVGPIGGEASAAAAVAAMRDNAVAASETTGDGLGSWTAAGQASADVKAGAAEANGLEDFGDDSWVDVTEDFSSPVPSASLSASLLSPLPPSSSSSITSPQPSEILSPQSVSPSSLLLDLPGVVWQGRVVNVSVVGDATGTLFLSRQKLWFSPDDKDKPLGFWDRGRCSWYRACFLFALGIGIPNPKPVAGMCLVFAKYTGAGDAQRLQQ